MTELEQLRAENAKLKAGLVSGARITLGNKGGVSVSVGKGWPTTLLPSEWATIFAMKTQIEQFCTDNAAELVKRQANPVVKDNAKAGLGKVI